MARPKMRLQWRGRVRGLLRDCEKDLTALFNRNNALVAKSLPPIYDTTIGTDLVAVLGAIGTALASKVLR